MICHKLNYFLIVCAVVFCCESGSAQTQWIEDLADSLINETDLCINCPRLSPQITSGVFRGETVFFLRYGCDVSNFFTQMRNSRGSVIGSCVVPPNASERCTNVNLDILTVFTFIQDARLIWTCDEGFLCQYAEENEIQDSLRILVNDEQCALGKKELYLSASYQSYQWEGPNESSIEPILDIDQVGLYRVTATDALGCSKAGSLLISSLDSLTVNLFAPTRICQGDTFSIFTNQFESYRWSSGSIDSTLVAYLPGEYSVTVSRGLNCIGTNKITVGAVDGLEFSLIANDTTIELGDTVVLMVDGVDPATVEEIRWSANTNERCLDCLVTAVNPIESSLYSVRIIDQDACTTTAELQVTVSDKEMAVYVPNAVRLSGQLDNATFGIYGKASITIEDLHVFDRWGNVVFSTSNVQLGDERSFWNGTLNGLRVEEGVYTYRTLLRNLNGEESLLFGDFILIH